MIQTKDNRPDGNSHACCYKNALLSIGIAKNKSSLITPRRLKKEYFYDVGTIELYAQVR